ncbi:MAG: hypothetical protein ACU83P_08390, partial [Gammaproteobacteria bacterium]
QEAGESGLFEHLTVVSLLPGILFGLHTFRRDRDKVHPLAAYWVLVWSLALIYFAGEEASWGQWYFHWDTPDMIARVNSQGETNLHNISPWFDQIPRLLVQLFIFVGGFLVPLLRVLGYRRPFIRYGFLEQWEEWFYAPTAVLPAGILFVLIKIAAWVPLDVFVPFKSGELREFVIAWFLMWYLISYSVRLKPAV